MGPLGQEGATVHGKAAGMGARKDNSEERTDGWKKLILKGCLGKHRTLQKLLLFLILGTYLGCCSSELANN